MASHDEPREVPEGRGPGRRARILLVVLGPLLFFGLAELVDGKTWLLAVVLAPVLAAVAAWLPSLLAAQKDPATILRHD